MDNENKERVNNYLVVTAKQAGRFFMYKLLYYFLGFFTQIFYVRTLGTEGYRIVSGILATVSFATLLAILGIPNGFIKYVAFLKVKNEGAIYPIYKFGIKLIVFTGIISAILYTATL